MLVYPCWPFSTVEGYKKWRQLVPTTTTTTLQKFLLTVRTTRVADRWVCVVCVVVITDTRIVIRCAHFQGNFSNKRKTKPIFTDKWRRRGSGECRLYQVFGICVLPFSVAMTTLKWADLRHYLLIKRLAKRIPLPLFPSSIPSCFYQQRRQCQCWQTAMGYSQGRDRVPAWSRLAFN